MSEGLLCLAASLRLKAAIAGLFMLMGMGSLSSGIAGQTSTGTINSVQGPPAAVATLENGPVLGYLVNGIIRNAQWPSPSSVVRLCIAGSPALLENIQTKPLQNRHGTLAIQSISPQEQLAALKDCSVLFIGEHTPQNTALKWVLSLYKWPIVTIWENPEECSSGTMICLYTPPAKVPTFDVNLDSVSRSGVLLNPMVLTLTNHMPSDLLPATNPQ